MSLRSLVAGWNRFFFEPRSPLPIALYRILYGLLTIVNLLYLAPDWLDWFGPHAWVSIQTMHALEPGIRLNLFSLIPQTNAAVDTVFWVFLICAITLTIGFFTRVSTILVFLCATSIHQRNIYNLHAGDTLMRVTGFFLMFAPAGAALSIDRLLRIWRGREGVEVPLKIPWAQRMIQFEVALVYLSGFWWKSMGADWVDGNALYYVMHVAQMKRFPLPPFAYEPMVMKLGSWLTLAFEFTFGVFIWFKETRYVLLLMGVAFHLLIEYSLNIQLFEWMMIASYVVFLNAADISWAGTWTQRRLEALLERRQKT